MIENVKLPYIGSVWADIKGYESIYQISITGNIRSLKWNKIRILTPSKNSTGYLVINLYKNKKRKSFLIHQLMGITFLDHIPDGHITIVEHKDNDKLNNKLENLQIITQRKNVSKDVKNKTSKYTGVCWHSTAKKWMSYIHINNKSVYLGLFDKELDASIGYQNKLKELI